MDLLDLNEAGLSDIIYNQLQEHWINDNVAGCLMCLDNQDGLAFVMDNIKPLLENGYYEEALLIALTGPRVNLSNYPFDLIRTLLGGADKNKMRAQGDKMPHEGPFTLYRGVSGVGKARRKRGVSWTASFEKAQWFAKRLSLDKPMVYQAEVPIEFVYAYTNERNEQEFICLLPEDHKLKKVWP
ncbi:MAG: hypothetical protein ACLFRO_05055 [Desulfobacterales bacterium]